MKVDGQHRDAAVGISPDNRAWLNLIRRAMAPMGPGERRRFLEALRSLTPEQIESLTAELNAQRLR